MGPGGVVQGAEGRAGRRRVWSWGAERVVVRAAARVQCPWGRVHGGMSMKTEDVAMRREDVPVSTGGRAREDRRPCP